MTRRYGFVLALLVSGLALGCGSTTTSEPDATPPDASPPDADPPDVMPVCGNGMIEFGETCDDSGESATCNDDCTTAACGDGKVNATAGESCDDTGESATCDDDCTAVECGDGVTNVTAGETCDDSGVSATCDDDCTAAECGDGTLNDAAGEQCDLGAANSDYKRCGSTCFWGSGLDGTWTGLWATLTPGVGTKYALQNFHFTGDTLIREIANARTYNPATNAWGTMASVTFATTWADAAVDATALWIPRDGSMHKYTIATGTWSVATPGIPSGTTNATAADFDGEGNIWYKGPVAGDLVRYNPATGVATTIPYSNPTAVYMFETRVAYDPVTNSIIYAGFVAQRFLKYDIAAGTFSETTTNPGGNINDNTCGDRAGHVYTGSTSFSQIYQYNSALNTWTVITAPPFSHDNNSTCVVSQDGFLYFGAGTAWARIALGTH